MSVGPTALVTLAELKSYLGLTTSSQDAQLEALIDGVSAEIEDYCQSFFVIRTGLEEFHESTPNRSPRLFLRVYPVVQVTDIRDEAGFLIPLTEVNVRKERGELYRSGGWLSPQDANGTPGRWKVTYDAGRVADTASVPPAVKMAAKRLVAYRRETSTPGLVSRSMGQISATYAQPGGEAFVGGMPLDVANMLGPYKSYPT